jgi:polyisoprenoid-binding protein YceI
MRFSGLWLMALALAVGLVSGAGSVHPVQAEGEATRLSLVAGSEARFRAREVLVGRSLPSEAVGVTQDVSGVVTVAPDGAILADQSAIVVELRNLRTDTDRRDAFIKNETLQIDQYPIVTFVPTAAEGLPVPLPGSGQASFLLIGDLTIRNVTQPAVWNVTADFSETEVNGLATTSLTFEQYGMEKPSVSRVLSIEDELKLEIDFRTSREALLE